jgi:endonuclease/exonuclease/phosphatase (EEP) superfamily protein YafD
VAVATLAVSLLLSACRVFTPSVPLLVAATAFVPYAAPGYALTAGLLALQVRRTRRRARTWRLIVVAGAVVGLVGHLALLAPLWLGGHDHGRADLTVMTANLRLGHADPATVVRLVRQEHVDVLVLEEATYGQAGALGQERIRQDLPYVAGAPALGADGTLVLSRFPLTDQQALPTRRGSYLVRVGDGSGFWLLAVHATQPLDTVDRWQADWSTVRRAAADLHGPRLVVGDFNATLDHGPVRSLLGTGLVDAAEDADSGWQPTWPSGVPGYRLLGGLGLVAIDHVLLSHDFSAISTRTFQVPATDHRALVVRLAQR